MLVCVIQNDRAPQQSTTAGSLSKDLLRCKFLNKIVYAFLYNICELTQKLLNIHTMLLKFHLKINT